MPRTGSSSFGTLLIIKHGTGVSSRCGGRQCRNLQTSTSGIQPGLERRKKSDVADNIYVDSLQKTLDAHFAANRASLIRKAYAVDPFREQSAVRPLFLETRDESRSQADLQGGKLTQDIYPESNKFRIHAKADWRKSILASPGRIRYASPPWSGELSYPWTQYIHRCDSHGLERLNTEIQAYHEFMTPSLSEVQALNVAIRALKGRLESILPIFSAELVGSRATGLALTHSDIDFHLSLKSKPCPALNSSRLLEKAFDVLVQSRAKGSIRIVEHVNRASTPIIRAIHGGTGLDVQLQMASDVLVSREYVRKYLAEFPNLRPLFALIRSMLEIRGLTNVFTGGLGSYSILMMIVASLKHTRANSRVDDLSKQFLAFLDMFVDQDFAQTCISVDPPYFFEKHGKRTRPKDLEKMKFDDEVKLGQFIISKKWHRPHMCLQDPADPMNDLGCRSYAIKDIQKTMKKIRNDVRKGMGAWDKAGPSEKGVILGPVVGANYKRFIVGRRQLERYGKLRTSSTTSPSGRLSQLEDVRGDVLI